MNLNNLKAFVKVVEFGSFLEAAKHLSVTQPAISLRIQALEEHFNTKLINRTINGVQLTPQGEVIFGKIKEMLYLWESLEEQFLGGEPKGKLVIGASTIPSEYLLPKMIKEFKSAYPNVEFKMKISGSKLVAEWLANRTVDVAITGEPPRTPMLYVKPLMSEKLNIIAPIHFDDNEIKLFSDLFREDWIIREKNSDTRLSFEKMVQSLGCSLEQMNVVAELGSTEAVVAAVESGLGISVVSSFAAERAEKYGRVKIIEVHDFQVNRNFYFSCLAENKNIPLIAAFLQFFDKEMNP
ncbi:selenium metabolism-associated LysR family transcriptional regulator [Calidifontibacillus erzurumensis]|uniref:selenium metabolism-associated LysR family transcriptional regulator n=1 Tax=Calidifontibacillus erzurumensis TaxID=2741433 RepID=UPI0035B5447B